MAAPPATLPAPRAMRRHPSWVVAVWAVDLATPTAESRSRRSESVVLAWVCQPSDQPSCRPPSRVFRAARRPALTARVRSDFSAMGIPPWVHQSFSIDVCITSLHRKEPTKARGQRLKGQKGRGLKGKGLAPKGRIDREHQRERAKGCCRRWSFLNRSWHRLLEAALQKASYLNH